MTPVPLTVLVVAKAPVPGEAKTRLAAAVGEAAAADIAAAALLDTLDAVAETAVGAKVVALTGDLGRAARADEIRSRLESFIVITQRGETFGDRLTHAHADAAAVTGCPRVLQIGMDTPQVTPELLSAFAVRLATCDAVLGPARDGGWWALGVADAGLAGCLRQVPMSRPDTGALTADALVRSGIDVDYADELADVDTVADIPDVRASCAPSSRFALATAGITL